MSFAALGKVLDSGFASRVQDLVSSGLPWLRRPKSQLASNPDDGMKRREEKDG